MATIGNVRVSSQVGPALGSVKITSPIRTTIADPNFTPRPSVQLADVQGLGISQPQNGDVIAYDAQTGNFVNTGLDAGNIRVDRIVGGSF